MMVEITAGLVMVILSAVGILGCVIALIVTGPVFKKKRKKLLNDIEAE